MVGAAAQGARMKEARIFHSVRLVQFEPELLLKRCLVGEIGIFPCTELSKINGLAEVAGVDIAGVASSILATPTIFS
jgi:hypothetical protein